MKKLISTALCLSMLCSSLMGINARAAAPDFGAAEFTHQNVVGSQTCYADDTAEKVITEIPDVIQGIRINQPVFRVRLGAAAAGRAFKAEQLLKNETLLSSEDVTADADGVLEFKHVRNCEMIRVYYENELVASLGDDEAYVNGIEITSAPMSYQIYQRDENDMAVIRISGRVLDAQTVTVAVNGEEENAVIEGGSFSYEKELNTGLYDITVSTDQGEAAKYEQVGVGDVWVAAGQSNMTDMGAITDGFVPDTDDPVNGNMHIIYAEDTKWHLMDHPAGEGRFFKTGLRTSPVTSFAREIAASEGVPVGIVQTSVGGTNIWQWVDGVRNDPSSGYLIKALKSCFDKMPSRNIRGVLWYQGCNDAISDNYAFNYKNLQQKVFDEMHDFFGADKPIITTQINDANQDSTAQLGYYDAWSFVKDVQRRNEELYDNVYVVGTSEQELGDTIHNNAASNIKLGRKWARVAKNVVYGDESVEFRQPTIESAKVTGDHEITLTFKNTHGLAIADGIKRLGITNVAGGGVKIELGDLKKEFTVRKGGNKVMTASNTGKGTELTVTDAQIVESKPEESIPETTESYTITGTTKKGARLDEVTVVSKETADARLIAAQYTGGRLIGANIKEVSVAPGMNKYDVSDIELAENADVNIMLWDRESEEGMEPLAAYSDDITEKTAPGNDTATVVLTTAEELSGVIAVDALYGKRFVPSLVDAQTGESILAFYNVIAKYDGAIEVTEPQEIVADDTAYFFEGNEASDEKMYINGYRDMNAMALMKFDLSGIDTSKIVSARLAAFTTDIVKDRTGNSTISEISTDWDNTAVYGSPAYSSLKKNVIKTFNTNTASLFPVGNYSDIDITDYISSFEGGSIGIGIEADYAAVATLAGVNSDNPPKLIIQPGHTVELEFTADGVPCAGVAATIEGKGATEFAAKELIADENGRIRINLTEGTYTVKTSTTIGGYMESSNEFTVESSDVQRAFTLTKNTATPEPTPEPTKAPEEAKYTFGSAYNEIKPFNTSSLPETAIGDTGFKVSTSSSNYNTAVVRDKASANSGYFPYGSGLPENGYYLFLGSGGNSSVSAKLTLPQTAKAGEYLRMTYAKPKATNNGSTERSSGNGDNKITIGSEVIDLQNMCEFDKWYTTTVKLSSDVSDISFYLGKWSAAAISSIEIIKTADMLALEPEATEAYITAADRTISCAAKAYNSMTVLAEGGEVVAMGSEDESAAIEYSVNGYEGVSIDSSGVLTITPSAKAGKVNVSASYGGTTKTAEITLLEAGNADAVVITGDELVKKGTAAAYRAVPMIGGAVIPERAALWSIEGDAHGCTIDNGTLTVPSDAASGNITIKATLAAEGVQTSADVSSTFVVTIADDTASAYEIKGIFLKNGAAELASAEGVEGAAIDVEKAAGGCSAVIKAVDENGIVIAQTSAPLSGLAEGVQEVKAPLAAKNAAQIRAYVVNGSNEIISENIYMTDKGSYKNVPLVADWITGAKSGLGMGAGIMAPTGAPYGVDPSLVDVSSLNVSYTYDANYPAPSADNALWYKTGAFLAGNSSGNNSIYARDGVDWEQKALPIGNGYMGAMLFGLPDKDQIQFNEETFWAAGYRGVQSEVAANNVNKNMSEGINGFMSVGNIFADFHMPKGAKVNNYYRDLDLDNSVAHVKYEYDGVKYEREYFASYPKEVLAFRYTADKAGALDFDLTPVLMHPGEVTVKDGEITIIGKLKDSEPYNAGGNAAWNQESDLEYCAKVKVIADDGEIIDGYNTVGIKGASGVTVLVTAATDYDKDEFELNADGSVNMAKTPYKSAQGVQAAIDKANARMSGAAAMSYDELKAEHIADYKSQFDKVHFSLTGDEICKTPTDELQASFNKVVGTSKDSDGTTKVSYDAAAYKALDKHLEELHYNYARYMMISSSRSNTMPATLQGKWCQSTAEIWGSCYCININMEMNYWFAPGANLTDSAMSLVRWFDSQIPAGRVTARNMYKVTPKSYTLSDGKITFTDSDAEEDDVFIMHTKQAIMGTTDLTGSTSIQSAGNTAWLMYNLWDIYRSTGDKELLRDELYPIMRKAANFYTQYLYTNERKTTTDTAKYPDGYYYTTWEGRSPEQGPTGEGIKYDLQLVAGMYDYAIAAAEALGTDADKAAAWREIRDHLELPVELGDEGQIKEWAQETRYNTAADGSALGDPVHRHISHLVGLYPGTLINRDTPELLDGARIVLDKRGDDSTGWSCSNKFLLRARTLDGDKALEMFRFQLAKKTYSNLFDTHAPFQIDGNFGSAAGVMELLMQSQTGDIYILPALPSVWDKGEISGIKAKNGAEVSIKWENNKATEIKIIPAVDGDITIGYDKDNELKLGGAPAAFENCKYTISGAKAGEEYIFVG